MARRSIGKVNVDNNPQTAMKYGIRSIPTILFLKNGEVVDRSVGAVPKSQCGREVGRAAGLIDRTIHSYGSRPRGGTCYFVTLMPHRTTPHPIPQRP